MTKAGTVSQDLCQDCCCLLRLRTRVSGPGPPHRKGELLAETIPNNFFRTMWNYGPANGFVIWVGSDWFPLANTMEKPQSDFAKIGDLRVAKSLQAFIEDEALSGTGMS